MGADMTTPLGLRLGTAAPYSETSSDANAGRIEDQWITDADDCRARAAVEKADKAFNTLRATLALSGIELHIVSDGERGSAYMVHSWCMSRTLPDLDAVRSLSEQIEASHG